MRIVPLICPAYPPVGRAPHLSIDMKRARDLQWTVLLEWWGDGDSRNQPAMAFLSRRGVRRRRVDDAPGDPHQDHLGHLVVSPRLLRDQHRNVRDDGGGDLRLPDFYSLPSVQPAHSADHSVA